MALGQKLAEGLKVVLDEAFRTASYGILKVQELVIKQANGSEVGGLVSQSRLPVNLSLATALPATHKVVTLS